MPEPTSTATVTLVGGAAALPLLTVAGVSLGLRADVLLAGFSGAIAAMALLNTVPSTGDTWRELWNTSWRRVGVAIGSAAFAGYTTPLLAFINGVPQELLLSVAFVAGAGAQKLLARVVAQTRAGVAARPAGDQP